MVLFLESSALCGLFVCGLRFFGFLAGFPTATRFHSSKNRILTTHL